MANHVPVTEQLKDLSLGTATNIKDSIVGLINKIINSFASTYTVEFVFIISVLIAITIKRWKKLNLTETSVITLLIFFALRFLGVGS